MTTDAGDRRVPHHPVALPGGGFAFVMATGIVSIAAESQDLKLLALAFFTINLIAVPVLIALLLRRLIREPAAIARELSQHQTAAGFLTFVAAAAVLGNQFAIFTASHWMPTALWIIAIVSWTGFVYAFFVLLTIHPAKPRPRGGIDGGWLLVVVATEGLAIVGTYVDASFASPTMVIWASLCWFLLGALFYLIIIQLILYRWLFETLRPGELTPSYWINMGAMAIVTLAGSRLEERAGTEQILATFRPAIAILTTLFWTGAAWWIPLLVLLMIWRHTAGGVPASYRFEYWSMVFPLGMFTVATQNYSHVNGLDFLYWIPHAFIWVAVAAWAVCFAGLIRQSLRRRRAVGTVTGDH